MNEVLTDRQLEIIQSAGKIITKAGVKGLTTKNLAKEMGFSEAAIYRHFDSKEKIIIAMLENVAERMDNRYGVAMEKDESPQEKFRHIFQDQFNFFVENPHFVVAVFADGLFEESDSVNNAILKIMTVKIKYLKPIVKEGQMTGAFTSSVATDDLVHIVMGGIRLQMYKWRVANFQFDVLKKGEDLIESLLKLIKA